MMEKNKIRDSVIEILRKNPNGLTILDISKMLGINRNTITKYVYELSGAEMITYRKIGPAKLLTLSKKGGKND